MLEIFSRLWLLLVAVLSCRSAAIGPLRRKASLNVVPVALEKMTLRLDFLLCVC